ncbi:MAG: heavy metal translocating P-type ATPase [Acidobacteria bacterium]|nr:heavy metal translocating P-type ATPase [Acidobacteriota bacterium]
MNRLELRIHGLDCAEEVALLRRELAGRAGVLELAFDVVKAKMTVTHDPAAIRPQEIKDAVQQTGMRAEAWSAETEDSRPFWIRHSRALLTAMSGVALLCGSVTDLLQSKLTVVEWLGSDGSPTQTVAVLYALAALAGYGPSVPKLGGSIRARRADLSVLMAVSLTGAIFLGEWSEAGTLAFLFSMAGLLETWSLRKAQSSVASLLNLSPAEAIVLHHDHEHRVPVDRVKVGERLRVRPGERIPCDGVVVAGESSVDQAVITGEAIAVEKRPGDTVYAGTLNELGSLEIRTTASASNTALARIVRMVEGAQHRRAPSEQFVERFARYYTPAILALAVGVALLPPLLAGASAAKWFYQGMVVLLISCPCALIVSTPVTIVSALASAARRGVLVKGGAFLEEAAQLRAIAFDKTGVLTMGQPQVSTFVPVNGKPAKEILENLAGLELRSEHPLGGAIVEYARGRGIEPSKAEHFHARCGRGAEAEIAAETFWAGNWRFCEEKQLDGEGRAKSQIQALEDASHTAILCGTNRQVWAIVGLTDPLRPGAREAIDELRSLGVAEMAILTGDNPRTAASVGRELGISDIRAEMLPGEKLAAIEEMRQRPGAVAMVGDGINDAQAMAAASIGVALAGRSTDLALETADVVLASGDLMRLPFLLRHARRAVRVIRQNVWIAIGLKTAFLVLAMAGKASLWMAIAADMGATILVTLNGLRLLQPSREASRT